ncbi:MAG: hypothetical protein Q7Q73_15190 [Verrucomicrobiota bacterium JB024]|jgi:hypothetical protein|nr:hypothetical protein [Verrucomicrobiota bacterium JB024]
MLAYLFAILGILVVAAIIVAVKAAGPGSSTQERPRYDERHGTTYQKPQAEEPATPTKT